MKDTALRETPLRERHLAAGARMVPFAGWNMPVQYREGIIAEHLHTRGDTSVFDICHMGEFEISGTGVAAELDRVFARPTADQPNGSCRYNFLLNDRGGIEDDLIVYRIDEDCFFVVVNAATTTSDAEILRQNLSGDIELNDVSDETGKLDLQGPKAAALLATIGISPEQLPLYYRWTNIEIKGIPCLISRTGYTGELGFEFYTATENTPALWDIFTGAGAKPAGLGARDTLRLEMGYPLYGHELNPDRTPSDAGFGAMLKLQEMPHRRFIGCDALRDTASAGRLIGIRLGGRRAAREGMEVLDAEGKNIGVITSGAFAPSLGCAVAMAWVSPATATEPGTPLGIKTGGNVMDGVIAAMPFYRDGTARIKL